MRQIKHLTKILLIVFIIILQNCSYITDKHIGEWKGTDKGKTSSLILDENNHATLISENSVLGGEEFEIEGIKATMKYEIDYSKKPIWLDLVFYEQGKPKEKGRMKGIVRFITNNKIEYRLAFSGDRYDNFDSDDKENTIVLDKIEN